MAENLVEFGFKKVIFRLRHSVLVLLSTDNTYHIYANLTT